MKRLKLFVSMPMNGKAAAEIAEQMKQAHQAAERIMGVPLALLDTVFDLPEGTRPLGYLAESIAKLAEADVAYFCDGWERARGWIWRCGMDLDAKLAADTLRKMANFKQMLAFPHDTGRIINACADLIESLAAELEQVKWERDGLSIMLTQAQTMLETRTRERDVALAEIKALNEEYFVDIHTARDPMAEKVKQLERERDAAVEELRKVCQATEVCFCCKSHNTNYTEYVSNDCMDCIRHCNWQWRGVK